MKIYKQQQEQFITEMEQMGFAYPFLEDQYNMLVIGVEEAVHWEDIKDFGSDRMLYIPDLKCNANGLPYLYGYSATLIDTDPIEHGVFGTIDTQVLENCLREGHWQSDPEVFSELLAQTIQLAVSGNSMAKDISERLEARYWIGTPVRHSIDVGALLAKFGKTHYFKMKGDISDLTAFQAYSLMAGRSVLRFEEVRANHYRSFWLRLKELPKPKMVEGKQYHFEEQRHIGFSLQLALSKLPIAEIENKRIVSFLIRRLIDGEPALATLQVNGKMERCFITVDPQNKSFRIYNRDNKELDVAELISQKKSSLLQTSQKIATPEQKKRGKRL